MPTSFEEKFKKLYNTTNSNQKNNEQIENCGTVFKELIKNISQNISKDEILILMLLLTLKNKKANNSLTLALLYMLL